jgi:hypothetical protein
MSEATLALPMTNSPAAPVKKKRVLLIDTSRVKRDLRSETMRRLGMEVDCAADLSEARCWWRADLYDLVLIHVEDAPGPLDKFCDDLRSATPPQQLMFLVGGPEYLANTPGSDSGSAEEDEEPLPRSQMNIGAPTNGSDGKPQRWGLLEACRRISAIRSVCEARSRAIKNQPEPRRDSETSRPSRLQGPDLIELIREELQ